MRVEIQTPLPPTVNHYYRNAAVPVRNATTGKIGIVRKRVLSDRAEAWMQGSALMEVFPGRRDKDIHDVEKALELIESEGLFEMWSRITQTIYFWPETFYRYQTYIKPSDRRVEEANAAERRRTPKNTASLSPSLSLSHTHSLSQSRSVPVETVDSVDNSPKTLSKAVR